MPTRKFIRDRMTKSASATPRPFNAQIYQIPQETYYDWMSTIPKTRPPTYCLVLIQGSIVPVRAWFPRNGAMKPEALKVGNAVLCQYKLGNRGQIEIIGPGTVIPTVMSGSPQIYTPTAPDAILTGCQVLAIPQ